MPMLCPLNEGLSFYGIFKEFQYRSRYFIELFFRQWKQPEQPNSRNYFGTLCLTALQAEPFFFIDSPYKVPRYPINPYGIKVL